MNYQFSAKTRPNTGVMRNKVRHMKWTREEDELLKQLVNYHGENNWVLVSKFINNRNVRQCKERWNNYLSPRINTSPWTPEEDRILMLKYLEFGNQWSILSRFFKNRTYSSVKNRFLTIKRLEEKTVKKKSNEGMIHVPSFNFNNTDNTSSDDYKFEFFEFEF